MDHPSHFSKLQIMLLVITGLNLLVIVVGLPILNTRIRLIETSLQVASTPPTQATQPDPTLAADLAAIKSQLERLNLSQNPYILPVLGSTSSPSLGSTQLSDLLQETYPTTSPAPTTKGYISLTSPQFSEANVYKESADFSPIVSHIFFGQKYPFSIKVNNWYLISLPDGIIGWIQSTNVKETL